MKVPVALSRRTARTPRPFTETLNDESFLSPTPYEKLSSSFACWLGRMWKSAGSRKLIERSPGLRPTQLCVGKLSVLSEYTVSAAIVSRPLYWLTCGRTKSNALSSSVPGKRKLMLEHGIGAG